MRPVLLDLFCGAGGAGMGYWRAGFDVVGVDIKPQPRYPFKFVQADALTFPLGEFDAIHASPPCQDYSRAMRHFTTGYPRLIDPIRERLQASGLPWVIENVAGAPLPTQADLFGAYGVELCGTMFGRPVRWHRLFETSIPIVPPRGCNHKLPTLNRNNGKRSGGRTSRPEWRAGLGITWAAREADEAIPPVYTKYIGRLVLDAMEDDAAAKLVSSGL